MSSLQNEGGKWYKIVVVYAEKLAKLSDTSLTPAELADAQAEFDEAENEYLDICNSAYNINMNIYKTMAVMLAYVVRNISQIAFAKLRKRSWDGLYAEFILSFIHLFLSVLALGRYLFNYRFQKGQDPRYDNCAVIYEGYYNEPFLDTTLMLGLYNFILWVRIILVFRVNSLLGPTMNIIYNMAVEILKFMIILIIIWLIFVSAGRILFITIDEYATTTDTFITLFSATLGTFDFNVFNNINMVLEKEYGYAYLALFLVVTNVILLNFIIAILSNTYNQLQNVSNALYYKEIIKMRNIFEFDKYYSCLISYFIPFNVFLIPFMPFVMYFKS